MRVVRVAALAVLGGLVLMGAGCEREEDPEQGASDLRVVLRLQNDLMRVASWDSAEVSGTAFLIRGEDEFVPHQRLSFELDPPLGSIVFEHPTLTDTTDFSGIVDFAYRALGCREPGWQRIRVRADGAETTGRLYVDVPDWHAARLEVTISSDTLLIGGPNSWDDDVMVTAQVMDSNRRPMPQIPVMMVDPGIFHYEEDAIETDAAGYARRQWRVLRTGTYCFAVQVGLLADTVCCVAIPDTSGQ